MHTLSVLIREYKYNGSHSNIGVRTRSSWVFAIVEQEKMLIFLEGTSCSGKTTKISEMSTKYGFKPIFLDYVDLKREKNETYLSKWYSTILSECKDSSQIYMIDRFAPLSSPFYEKLFVKKCELMDFPKFKEECREIKISNLLHNMNTEFKKLLLQHKFVIYFINNESMEFEELTINRGFFDSKILNLHDYKQIQNHFFEYIFEECEKILKINVKFLNGPIYYDNTIEKLILDNINYQCRLI